MLVRQSLVAGSANVSQHPNARLSVTVHETGNVGRGSDADAHARLQHVNTRVASWHWQVDDVEAVQSFPHSTRCFHAGTARGNRESIAVEICVNSDGNYLAAVRNAAALVARILRMEGLPLSAVLQHHYWSGKDCPTKLRAGRHGVSWPVFMGWVSEFYYPPAVPPQEESDMYANDPGLQARFAQQIEWQNTWFGLLHAQAENNRNMLAEFTRNVVNAAVTAAAARIINEATDLDPDYVKATLEDAARRAVESLSLPEIESVAVDLPRFEIADVPAAEVRA